MLFAFCSLIFKRSVENQVRNGVEKTEGFSTPEQFTLVKLV